MRRSWTLSAKLGIIGATLLVVALASIVLTLWVTWQLECGAAAVNEAGRMRMQTWRLAQALAGSDTGRIDDLLNQFDQSVALLRGGDPSRPLFVPRDAGSQGAFAAVQQAWQESPGHPLPKPQPKPKPSSRTSMPSSRPSSSSCRASR